MLNQQTQNEINGDEHICGFERRLWTLHQEILWRWGVYTIFRWDRMHVPMGIPEFVWWFVPREAPQCYEITQFIEEELKDVNREAAQLHPDEPPIPGAELRVVVAEFHCLEPYVENAKIKEIAGESFKMLQRFLAGEETKEDKEFLEKNSPPKSELYPEKKWTPLNWVLFGIVLIEAAYLIWVIMA